MDEPTTKSAMGANHPESSERAADFILVIRPRGAMGALSETSRRLKGKKLRRKGWARYVRPVTKLWTRLQQTIQSLALPYER